MFTVEIILLDTCTLFRLPSLIHVPRYIPVHFMNKAEFQQARATSRNTEYVRENGTVCLMNDPFVVKFMLLHVQSSDYLPCYMYNLQIIFLVTCSIYRLSSWLHVQSTDYLPCYMFNLQIIFLVTCSIYRLSSLLHVQSADFLH